MKYDPQGTELINVENLEELILDLLVEELGIIEKQGEQDETVNFGLHRYRLLQYYTRWKRNMITDEMRTKGYFKDIDRNKRR